MNTDYVQAVRLKPQKRFSRLNSVHPTLLHSSLQQFWTWCRQQSSIRGILEDLGAISDRYAEDAQKIVGKTPLQFENEAESVGISYWVIEACVADEYPMKEPKIGHQYGSSADNTESADLFRSYFVEPVYEYIDEELDDQRGILAILHRYKHRCEWFRQDELLSLWSGDTSRGEKHLARDMYEYLYDQGLDFTIEPVSASGEIDLLGSQATPPRVMAEGKIFNPENDQGKGNIASGVAQLYRYLCDFNESAGYLVIFKTSPTELRLVLSAEASATPLLIHNNKAMFLLVIDLCQEAISASHSKKLKVVEIADHDLVEVIEAEADAAS